MGKSNAKVTIRNAFKIYFHLKKCGKSQKSDIMKELEKMSDDSFEDMMKILCDDIKVVRKLGDQNGKTGFYCIANYNDDLQRLIDFFYKSYPDHENEQNKLLPQGEYEAFCFDLGLDPNDKDLKEKFKEFLKECGWVLLLPTP